MAPAGLQGPHNLLMPRGIAFIQLIRQPSQVYCVQIPHMAIRPEDHITVIASDKITTVLCHFHTTFALFHLAYFLCIAVRGRLDIV